jgi:hypothetical protein
LLADRVGPSWGPDSSATVPSEVVAFLIGTPAKAAIAGSLEYWNYDLSRRH